MSKMADHMIATTEAIAKVFLDMWNINMTPDQIEEVEEFVVNILNSQGEEREITPEMRAQLLKEAEDDAYGVWRTVRDAMEGLNR
jgi:ABC-type phosphate/phosphonate transport system substrate-binding protein